MWTSGIVLIAVVLLTGTIVLGAPTTSKPNSQGIDVSQIKLGPPLGEADLAYAKNLTGEYYAYNPYTNQEPRGGEPYNPQNEPEVLNYLGVLWPKGIVPYVIDQSFSQELRSLLAEAVQAYNELTCIRWIPRTTETNYVVFTSGVDLRCFGDVGMTGRGGQIIQLTSACTTYNSVLHEMMHVLGYIHEQQRLDRDQYVEILWDNIPPPWRYAYQKATGPIDLTKEPYDYNSVMHYDQYSFARPKLSMQSKNPNIQDLGNQKNFTMMDLDRINRHYNCPKAGSKPPVTKSPPESISTMAPPRVTPWPIKYPTAAPEGVPKKQTPKYITSPPPARPSTIQIQYPDENNPNDQYPDLNPCKPEKIPETYPDNKYPDQNPREPEIIPDQYPDQNPREPEIIPDQSPNQNPDEYPIIYEYPDQYPVVYPDVQSGKPCGQQNSVRGVPEVAPMDPGSNMSL